MENENKKKIDFFEKNKIIAKNNLEKCEELKQQDRIAKDKERQMFSPVTPVRGENSTIEVGRSSSVPLAMVFSQNKTGSKQHEKPPAGVLLSPFKREMKNEPQYDDFMNSVFSNKQHRSYILREKADLRSKVITDKFGIDSNRHANDLKRINKDYERMLKEKSHQLEERMLRQRSMAS